MSRRPLFQSPDELYERGMEYFANLPKDDPPLITALAEHLGTSRKSLWEYGKKEGYAEVVDFLKNKVEMAHERRLFEPHCTGSIYFLKGYCQISDNTRIEFEGETVNKIEVHVVDPAERSSESV